MLNFLKLAMSSPGLCVARCEGSKDKPFGRHGTGEDKCALLAARFRPNFLYLRFLVSKHHVATNPRIIPLARICPIVPLLQIPRTLPAVALSRMTTCMKARSSRGNALQAGYWSLTSSVIMRTCRAFTLPPWSRIGRVTGPMAEIG